MDSWGCGMCMIDSAGNHELDCPLADSPNKGEVMTPSVGYIEPAYHSDYILRRERDEAKTQRDKVGRLYLKERERAEKLEQERDEVIADRNMWEKAANLWRENWETERGCSFWRESFERVKGVVYNEIKRREMWIEIARKNFRHVGEMMRERDEALADSEEASLICVQLKRENKRLIKMVEEGCETETRLQLREVEREKVELEKGLKFWRESFDDVKMDKETALDLMKKWMDIATGRKEQAEKLQAQNDELESERDELRKELDKEIAPPRGYAYPDYIERDKAIAERDEAWKELGRVAIYEPLAAEWQERAIEARTYAQIKYDECERLKRELQRVKDNPQYHNLAEANDKHIAEMEQVLKAVKAEYGGYCKTVDCLHPQCVTYRAVTEILTKINGE